MATAIVSIACQQAGLQTISLVLLWLAVVAFVPLAVLDLVRARHPLRLLHRAGQPEHGFSALGFVADTCVVGARIVDSGNVARTICLALLAAGGGVWLLIMASLLRSRAGGHASAFRGEWLLAVVSTEGLAILSSDLAARGDGSALHAAAVVLCLIGAGGYVLGLAALAARLHRALPAPHELTPDLWIVMGAPAIIIVAALSIGRPALHSLPGILLLATWTAATVALVAIVVAEAWRARRIGLPSFTPARWTTVFPLGMYSAANQLLGPALGISGLRELGRLWAFVALAAWVATATGELHHAFIRGPNDHR
jgi:tellurite resistance protein TehA-like permease